MDAGAAILVDAHGCDAERLRSLPALEAIFAALVRELDLHPVAPATWHRFPGPGGLTGFLVLAESHLSVHTYPERGFAAIDLYCCRALPAWPWEARLADLLGAAEVRVTVVARGAPAAVPAGDRR